MRLNNQKIIPEKKVNYRESKNLIIEVCKMKRIGDVNLG